MQHFFSNTPHNYIFQPFPAMRSNNNNICFHFFCCIQNRIGKITFFDNCLNCFITQVFF